jgi:type II secretory pathway component GspD/PulD (secretin)
VGSVTYERKVNMVVVYDNELATNRVKSYLANIDRPKHQIPLQVRVLSINLTAAKNVVVDWSSTFGGARTTLPVTAGADLNSMFGWTNVVTSTVNKALGITNGVTNSLSNSNINGFKNNPGSLTNGPFINSSSTNLNGHSFGTNNSSNKQSISSNSVYQ